ncbi:AraC family transcriptional regulator [Peristeroidobacter agariperforans]|uniref:AraC family transcriptional regulator n=1 Tax=Peristeroidobacter agariperforans TaxID=268404 RepID=UPI00101D3B0A|nr:helix-turn-helix domain-containing protein [Peristeroidobacter agariperforans]
MNDLSLFDLCNIAIAGFAAISAVLLLLAYVALIDVPGKSIYSIASCTALVAALATIQVGHLVYFTGGGQPLAHFYYRLALFMAPPAFYSFGRWAILPTETLRPLQLLHFLPIPALFLLPLKIALPILFTLGAGYSLWLGNLVYGLRDQRKQFRFEFLYFTVMSVLAVIVLGLGFAIPYIDHDYFYYFYNNAVALGVAIMLVALVGNPNLIGDLTEAARVKYGASTLREVDVDASLAKLNQLMTDGKAYQNESLSLASLAEAVGLSGHQLSELINTRLGIGFSRYVRECRVNAAKTLLISAPSRSILSISMDTGFRSQSAFYAAFKEATGQSPGDYRRSQTPP